MLAAPPAVEEPAKWKGEVDNLIDNPMKAP